MEQLLLQELQELLLQEALVEPVELSMEDLQVLVEQVEQEAEQQEQLLELLEQQPLQEWTRRQGRSCRK